MRKSRSRGAIASLFFSPRLNLYQSNLILFSTSRLSVITASDIGVMVWVNGIALATVRVDLPTSSSYISPATDKTPFAHPAPPILARTAFSRSLI
jgi:hypothetical protein